MQRKLNLTQVICLQMGKTTETKLHQVILRSPLPKIHYYQSQAVTSTKNLTKPFDLSRNTNLQLNPYSNTQLDFQRQSFHSMHKSQNVTNSPTWRKLLTAKFFSSSIINIKKLLDHKILGVKTQLLLQRIMNQATFCILSPNACAMTFKIIFIYV